MVTNRCNLHCRKCYSPKTGPEGSLDEICFTITKLSDAGIRRIILTGGEPLVRDDIAEIASHASKLGLDVCLSTNGILLTQKWAALSPHLSWVGISLDAPSAELNYAIVGPGASCHFNGVHEFLRYRKEHQGSNVKLKLGTVVTKQNIGALVDLGNLIFSDSSLYVPDTWRLYQYSECADGCNTGSDYNREFAITEEEMGAIVRILRAAFPRVNLSYLTASDRDEAYVFVLPGLDLAYPCKGGYVRLGDTRTMTARNISDVLSSIERIAHRAIMNREIYERSIIQA